MSLFTSLRDAFESVAAVVANYYLPGSGLVTSHLVSKGSQEQLGSTVGRVAMAASGIAGAAEGNLANYGKAAESLTSGNAVSDAASWATKALNDAQTWTTSVLSGSAADATSLLDNTAGTITMDGGQAGQNMFDTSTMTPSGQPFPASQTPGSFVDPALNQVPATPNIGTGGYTGQAAVSPAAVTPGPSPSPSGGLLNKAMSLPGRAWDVFSKADPSTKVLAGSMAMQAAGGLASGYANANIEQQKLELAKQQLAMPETSRTGIYAPVGPAAIAAMFRPNPLGPDGRPLGQVSYPVVAPGLINAQT